MSLDIDECVINADDCDQLCVNDLGSYHCECYTGYLRDNNSCVGWWIFILSLSYKHQWFKWCVDTIYTGMGLFVYTGMRLFDAQSCLFIRKYT